MGIGAFLRNNGCVIIVVAALLGCIGAVFYPVYLHETNNARRAICQAQLKNIMVACFQYQQDYEGKFPPISDGSSRGWAEILHARDGSLKFSCPASYATSFSPTSDYFFNAHLATFKYSSVREPGMTISFGEGVDNGPTNSHYWELPNDDDNPDSTLRRHLDGANYAFADGHVKWMRPKIARGGWYDEEDRTGPHVKFSPEESASHVRKRARNY